MHRCGSFMDRTHCTNFLSDGLENKVTRAPGFDLDVRLPAHRPRLGRLGLKTSLYELYSDVSHVRRS